MYGIFTNIYPINNPNIVRYAIHGANGLWQFTQCSPTESARSDSAVGGPTFPHGAPRKPKESQGGSLESSPLASWSKVLAAGKFPKDEFSQ